MKATKWMAVTGVVLTSSAWAGSALAAPRQVEFAPQDGQTVEFVNGRQFVLASGSGAAVAISYVAGDDDGWIQVSVQNRSESPFNVQETSLAARLGDTPVQTYTYDELAASQKHKAWLKGGLAVLAAGMKGYGAGAAGYHTTTGTYNANTTVNAYGSGGYATAHGTTNGTYYQTTYDPAAAASAQASVTAENQAMMAQLNQREAQEKGDLESRVLRANTVHPGETVSGEIKVDLPSKSKLREQPLTIAFTAGGEEFTFALKEAE